MNKKAISTVYLLLLAPSIQAKISSHVGDLMARDLDFIGASYLGHVGLASSNSIMDRPTFVLEGMSSIPHIQQNSIQDFKTRSTYWGSKGGLVSPFSRESFYVANRIVQQYYACPEYSYTSNWHAGTITSDAKPITCGLFRCDTLINWAYAFDPGNYSLPTYNTAWTNPVALWNYFPVESDLFIPANHMDRTQPEISTHEGINSITQDNIKDLKADMLYKLIQNSQDIDEQQITSSWGIFVSNVVDIDSKILFYDFISFYKPSYLTEEIIQQSKKERGEAKHKLLATLQEIYQDKLNRKDNSGLETITNYFIKLQNEDLTKDDAGIVYRAVSRLSPQNIHRKKQKLINIDNIHIDIQLIKSNPTNQHQYVEDIISNIEHPDDGLLVTASYQYLTQLLINSDLKFFDKDSKRLFINHLRKNSMTKSTENMLYTPAYVEFKAALNADKVEDIPVLSTQYIQALNPDYKKVAPYGFSDFTQKKLKINNNEMALH